VNPYLERDYPVIELAPDFGQATLREFFPFLLTDFSSQDFAKSAGVWFSSEL